MKTRINTGPISAHQGKLALFGLLAASAAAFSLLPTSKAHAHGYVMGDAKSRSLLCSSWEGEAFNANCAGNVASNPNGIEYAPSGRQHYSSAGCSVNQRFMQCGPANGWIASGGLTGDYATLNEQTPSRWYKTPITPGEHTFTWKHTASHATAYWEYYITKPGWNPNQPLTRDAFEPNPIASFDGHSQAPPNLVNHKVNIPADRSGYHVLLSVWATSANGGDRNSFYQVVDLDIDNGDVTPPAWNQIGSMPLKELLPGDRVGVRVIDKHGSERPGPTLIIQTEQQGHPNMWSYGLATGLNNTSNIGFRTGLLNANDEVKANHGPNNFYVRPDSSVASVILDIQHASPVTNLELGGLQDSYTITDGKLNLHFNALVAGEESYTIGAQVLNQAGTEIAYQEGPKGEHRPHFHIPVEGVATGTYSINVTAYNANWEPKANTSHGFDVVNNETPGPGPSPEHDFVYPQGLGQYAAGTKVLQPKDGNVYECKPWPYTDWCNQDNAADPAFEPGTGRAWQEAWIRK